MGGPKSLSIYPTEVVKRLTQTFLRRPLLREPVDFPQQRSPQSTESTLRRSRNRRMSTCRLNLRPFALLAISLTAHPIFTGVASAGCFDCLFGRKTPAYTYQPVGPPVVTMGPITSATVPVNSVPVNSGLAPMTLAPALQTPVAPIAPVGPAPVSLSPGIAPTSGAISVQRPAYGVQPNYYGAQPAYAVQPVPVYAVQRPAFGVPATTNVQTFENPNVYSGLPTINTTQIPTSVYSAQRLPLVSRSTPNPVVYPNTTAGLAYMPQTQSAYRVPIASTLRGTTGFSPITSSPVYTSNYPSGVATVNYIAPAAPPPSTFGTGLSRFFSSPLGSNTRYNTSYSRAPITYYRPMTSVDPVTGTTVTVQRPCSSYVQQLQRVPYNSFRPLGPAPIPTTAPATIPTQTCPTNCPNACSSPSALPLSSAPATIAPPTGGIGQVGGQLLPNSPGVTPIPSTMPSSAYSSPGFSGPVAPNTSPLTGNTTGADAADNQGVSQPRLEAGRPATESHTPADKSPAIQLDPPVDQQTRATAPANTAPANPFSPSQPLASHTPPSLEPTKMPTLTTSQQYSTLRPIGVASSEPAKTPATTTPPLPSTPPFTSSTAPQVVEQPTSNTIAPPPLPAPSTRGTSPSSLFRNTESSASSRYPSQNRVSVPVREATTRHQNVRQVAAWEDIQTVPSPRQQRLQQQPVPVRDNSGWMPAR